MLHLYAWALALMTILQPTAPWADTYEATALAIVDEASAHPLFAGERAVVDTVALDVAVAWFESRFDPAARGDKGASLGLYQINRSHAPEADLLTPARATAVAHRLFAQSRLICGARPPAEYLGWYAAGGNGCGNERARRLSAHRWELARRLVKDHPPPALATLPPRL